MVWAKAQVFRSHLLEWLQGLHKQASQRKQSAYVSAHLLALVVLLMFCLAGCSVSGQKLLKGFDQLRVVMQQLAYLHAGRDVWCKVWNLFEISICRHAEYLYTSNAIHAAMC